MTKRLSTCGRLAIGVFFLATSLLHAETRPHYGGTLRVQLLSMFPDPEKTPLTAETLVRLDEHGDLAPLLARGWQGGQNRWRFLIRTKLISTSAVASKLAPIVKEWDARASVTSTATSVVIQTDRPMSDLLERLARPEAGIAGTGPFRVAKWDSGKRAILEANEDYAGGRPFVDSVDFTAEPQHSAPYQLSSADIWELPVGVSRRLIPDGMRVWTSPALDLVALWLKSPSQPLRDALSLSIDRSAIVNVLTQRRGEAASGLLPQWLTGYEFLFAAPFDPTRAREVAKSANFGPMTLHYDASDPLVRSVAGRVAVNAREAGIALQISTSVANADIELRRIPLECMDAARALHEIAAKPLGDLNSAEALYRAERSLLDENRIVPLVHVPRVFGIGPRVHAAGATGLPACDLLGSIPNLWLAP